MTVAELLRRISSTELTEWKALFDIHYEEGQRKAPGNDYETWG